MAVNDVLSQLQVLLKKSTPLIETGGQGADEPLKFTPGQQVQAKVLAALPNSRFLVQVDDRHLDLNLPRNTQPGNNVELRFVGNQPRPTFILANDAPQAPGRAPVNLSDTARFIGALLNKAKEMAAQAETPLARSAPVMPGAPADPKQLAVALRSALAQSGLFYESHQAQWVAGQRSLGELLKEPQAQLSQPRAFADAQRPEATSSAPTPGGDTRAPTSPRADMMPPPNQSSQMAAPAPEEAASRAPAREFTGGVREQPAADPIHASTAPVVQQQLDVLDTRQVVWQGQVWPGQLMHWQIEERDARDHSGAESASEWQTQLALTLPSLGEVGAQLRLSAQGIRIELTAAQSDTAQRLLQATAELKAGFDRADLNLVQLVVKQSG